VLDACKRPTAKRQPTELAPDKTIEVVDTAGASRIVGLSPATLSTLRSRGGGPPFCKVRRRVCYRIVDLRAWRDAGLMVHTGAAGS
jgi:hypothetical protein